MRELQITQTLDERQADKGKLLLEIKALGRGLIPELEQLVAVAPAGFDVVRVDDPGVSVAKYDVESAEPAVLSERLWTVTLAAHAGQQPRSFTFAKAKVADAKMTYQRFQDADLINATEQIDLDANYGKLDRAWLWWLGGGGVVCVALGVVGVRRWRRRPAPTRPRFELPSDITPFTVLQLLGRLQHEDGLRPEQKAELAESITTIQRRYFAAQEAPDVNLRQLAEKWLTTTQAPES